MLDEYPQGELAERLRAALEAAEISPSYLAEQCGVTRQAVNGWLKTGRIAKAHLSTIARETNTPLEFWLEGRRGESRRTQVVWEHINSLAKVAPAVAFMALPFLEVLRGCVLCKIDAPRTLFREAIA